MGRPENCHTWRWASLVNPGFCIKCGEVFKRPGYENRKESNYYDECPVKTGDLENYHDPSEGRRYGHDRIKGENNARS